MALVVRLVGCVSWTGVGRAPYPRQRGNSTTVVKNVTMPLQRLPAKLGRWCNPAIQFRRFLPLKSVERAKVFVFLFSEIHPCRQHR